MIRRALSILTALGATACTVIAGVSSMEIEHTAPSPPTTKTVENADGPSDEVDPLDESEPPPTGGSSGASSTSSSSSGGGSDAGPSSDDAGPTTPPPSTDPRTPLNATFDTSCAGWSTNGELTWDPEGHNGPGACRLCATTSGETVAERTVTTSQTGYAQVSAWMRRVSGSVTDARLSVVVPGLQVSVVGTFQDSWVLYKNSRLPQARSGSNVSARVRMMSAAPGDCIVFDDATITLRD